MWRILRPDATAVLNDKMVRKSLGRYFDAMQNRKTAKFLLARKLPAEFSKDNTLEQLWQTHDIATEEFCRFERRADTGNEGVTKMMSPDKSYLDLKIEIANRILRCCHLCTRRCGADRFTDKLGYCGCGTEMAVSSIFEHVGEEPELVPSGTIFTMGCTMRCKHCQNCTISQWMETGQVYKPEDLANEVERLRNNGCRNANLVGGEPTPWLRQWLETFKHVSSNVPIVWNSNTYYSPETAKLLVGFADVYLLDFKYGPGDCAERISDAPKYWEACTRNHLEAKKHGELLIRVLVLPNHLECCTKPILRWIAENLATETRVNVMFQYRPEWRAHEVSELGRRLTGEEMGRAVELAKEAGLTNFIT
jgi:putative pyruvate formate lyase activating enzyme